MAFKQLTYEERLKIELGVKNNMSCSQIAKEIGRARQTVFRELKLFSTPNGYNADLAQQKRGYRDSSYGGL